MRTQKRQRFMQRLQGHFLERTDNLRRLHLPLCPENKKIPLDETSSGTSFFSQGDFLPLGCGDPYAGKISTCQSNDKEIITWKNESAKEKRNFFIASLRANVHHDNTFIPASRIIVAGSRIYIDDESPQATRLRTWRDHL